MKGLLAGELVDTDELAYEFGDWHIAAIGRGETASLRFRDLAQVVDRQLLMVRIDRETTWAWFGGRRRVAVSEIAHRLSQRGPLDGLVTFGEPARGIEGWRLSHQQARAAEQLIRPGATGVVQYADVGLLASIARDRLLAISLRQLYLDPLAGGRKGGVELRRTLRAYFAADRNSSSAASALGVSRQTVGNRLRTVEEKLGRTLQSCAAELEVALRLDDADDLIDPIRS